MGLFKPPIIKFFYNLEFLISSSNDWDILWCGRDWMNNHFNGHAFLPNQKVSHFQNDYELARKDNLVRNFKKMRRQLDKNKNSSEAKKFDFIPASYVLPQDYHLFVEQFRQHPVDTVWIMKPVSGAQGRGIFLFRKLKDITEWKKVLRSVTSEYRTALNRGANVENYLVQSYISDPYLIGGKKFDMRIYVAVVSFQPLKVWVHRDGFVRFSHAQYNVDSIEDAYVHLTNVAIAKTAPDYDPDRGLKWSFFRFRRFIESKHCQTAVRKLLDEIGWVVVRSLECVQQQMVQDRHCFEVFGYDILLDKELKPWLLEVNASPSLSASSQEDYNMKFSVLNHALDVVDLSGKFTDTRTKQIGGFDLLMDGTPVRLDVPHLSREGCSAVEQPLNLHLGAKY